MAWCASGILAAALACGDETIEPNPSPITATSVAPRVDTLKFIYEGVRLVATSQTSRGPTRGQYRWSVSDAALLSSALVAADTFMVFARAEGTGLVRVVEQGGTRDSALIVVRQQTGSIHVTPELAYRACPVQLGAVAVDSGGTRVAHPVSVTLVSRNPALATIDTAWRLTPLAAGLDTILATAESVSTPALFRIEPAPVFQVGNTPFSTVVIGATQFATLAPRATSPVGAPVTLQFQTSDSTVARMAFDTVALLPGYQVAPGTDVVGLVPGTGLVRVAACDVVSDSVTVRVTTPKFLISPLPPDARTDDRPWSVQVQIGDSLGALGPTYAPLAVHVFPTDSTVIRADSAYLHVPARTYATTSVLTWANHGTARVVFADSAGRYTPDTSRPVAVSYPPLLLSVVRDTIALGMRQQRSLSLGLDRTVADSPLTVRVTSSDTAAASVSPTTLTMAVGTTGGPPLAVTGHDTNGVTTIVATAYRHEPAAVTMRITRPQFLIVVPISGVAHYPGDATGDVSVFATDSVSSLSYSGGGIPTDSVVANIASSDPSVASLDSASLTIPAGRSGSGVAHLSYNAPGMVTLTASDPRTAYYRYGTVTSAPIQIVPKRLVFSDSAMLLGIGQYWSDAVFLEGRIPYDLVVSLTHTSPSVARLALTTDTLRSTNPSGPVPMHGLASGVDTVVASATGWIPDTLPVVVGLGTIELAGWPATLGRGNSASIYLQVGDQAGNGRLVDSATTFTLSPNANIVFTDGSNTITAVTIPAGNATTGYFYVQATAPGTGTVSITNPNYQQYSNSLTVTP